MRTVTIAEITESLRKLPAEKLAVGDDFVSYISERELGEGLLAEATKAIEFMFASEAILRAIEIDLKRIRRGQVCERGCGCRALPLLGFERKQETPGAGRQYKQ
ncbi:MAG: hypothetical protein HY259_14295 [Chloroflexi bacterium]|nr:hypothetical protein [Chloroflexota bacterium]MBI3734605.1 hypothetical protein [Chloroflexota bacterium]